MASSIGRKTVSNRSLLAAKIPKGTPARQQNITDESTMARVVMVSAHRPSRPINTIETTENIARPIPENRQATIATATITMIGCNVFKPESKPFKVCSMGHLMAWKISL